jgi:membrane-bound lytic murein transglycosylase B
MRAQVDVPAPRRAGLVVPLLTLALLLACSSTASSATDPPAQPASAPGQATAEDAALQQAQQQAFTRWVTAFRARAKSAGINEATLRAAFDDARYLPRVIELDRAQPEHTRAIWDYLDVAVSPQRIAQGQEKLLQFRAPIDAAAVRFGVAPEVLVAIWGLESKYGEQVGNMSTLDALATLGFDGRREAWAREQLLAALKILQSGDVTRASMIGSWAGAMGQTQFLPTSFLGYAVDADGDGRRDIWGSVADVLASTANFLSRSGWRAGQPWGVEVRLPAEFDVARADPALRRPTSQWVQDGVRGVETGAPLPEFADAAILLPAGARGPAFLVGPNFRAILRFNNSNTYALAVGLLAQRLANPTNGPGVQTPWPRDLVMLTRTQVLALQNALNSRGFDGGEPDGMAGNATRNALRRYQRSIGVPADGYPTLELLERLLTKP